MDVIPKIGMGTRGLQGEKCYRVIRTGIDLGYQMIDTAEHYQNEKEIGIAIKDAGISRDKLRLTTKIRKESFGDIQQSCEERLLNLGTDYIDLLLLHRPTGNLEEHRSVFEQLLSLKTQKKVRKVGVSNFTISQIQDLISFFGEEVFANEIEFHLCLSQEKMLNFSTQCNIEIISYSPFGHGHLFHIPLLQQYCGERGYSIAQFCLSWLLKKGVIVIPKASSKQKLQENLQSLKCILSEEDFAFIEHLPKYYRYITPPFAPLWD